MQAHTCKLNDPSQPSVQTSLPSMVNTVNQESAQRVPPAGPRTPFCNATTADKALWQSTASQHGASVRTSINALPNELKSHILGQLPHTALFDTSLFAMAATCQDWRKTVQTYLSTDAVCRGYGNQLLRKEVITAWQAGGQKLIDQAPALRAAFTQSSALITQGVANQLSDDAILQSVAHLPAVALDFTLYTDRARLVELAGKIQNRVIKLNASGVGQRRMLDTVLPALEKIRPECPVILLAPGNYLFPKDLRLLVNTIKKNPCVYHLDLSKNSLCNGYSLSSPLLALFETPTPLSRLLMTDADINDETAQQISHALSKNPCLRHLDLQGNEISENAALSLIRAVGSVNEAGGIAANTVLRALRLQSNEYGNRNETIFTAIRLAHLLVAKAKNPDFDVARAEAALIVQVDGVGSNISCSEVLSNFYRRQFNEAAEADSL